MKLARVKTLTKRLSIAPSAEMYERTLRDTLAAQKNSARVSPSGYRPHVWRVLVTSRGGALIAACLTISLGIACTVLYRSVEDLKQELAHAEAQPNLVADEPDNSATINLYLKEHQDVVARHAALGSGAPQPVQMRVSPDDIMYYEFFGGGPDYMRPGMIVRGPLSQQEFSSTKTPAISNGHTLSLSEARETAGFMLLARPWLHPGYKLDEIRRIESRDALQLIYTDGINSVSLFEQPLDGQRGLSRQDFREYAVYRNKEQGGGTILAWRDDEVSYVLIGKAEMSQLMDMAQSISAGR